ncbi:hypothetical protein M2325_001284 [Methanococcus voltae PS]|uniref:Uncharacterized protein n=1 Tax=Methanococcus voltae PS TaxID=523842 RepID=A0ABT2EZK0_METVO|nr:hypothetical protein [Methanococcus voltae]MCS3922588.1 hypothetical protein [Methanococcus voltae PS]
MNIQQSEEDIINERMEEYGYPSSGYIITNKTVRYSDASFVILSNSPKKYSIGGVQALNKARAYLNSEYNQELAEHNYMIDVEPESIEEYRENDNYYWMFKMRFGKVGTEGDFMGYVMVDRRTGHCKMEGLFG